MFGDQYKGFMDFRSNRPDQDPNFALLYIGVGAVVLAAFLVGWLGWTWLTLAAFITIELAVIGSWLYLRTRSRRRQEERRVALREADRWV